MNLAQSSATNFNTVSTMSTPSGCTTNSASSISSNTTPNNPTVSVGNGGSAATPNNKLNVQQQMTNGLFIRKEIQRFESVHPNIYSVYDLIDNITDFNLQQQIREHIVNIEDSFVNSQEWTLSRSVPDLKLGILGSINSGKSSLVHRFLTGTYMQEESPEGGRFKKEVVIDGQSYLLLIRDEGGPPELQFTHWVDVVIFVFSLENEESFNTIHQYCLKMNHYRNMCDVPFILVGTQDYISESNPRVIEDSRARNLANELKKCSYYETCATYGLHVERVFHDACQKVVNLRTQLLFAMANISSAQINRPTTPLQANSNIITNNSNNNQQMQHQTNSIRLLAGSHLSNNNGQPVSIAASAVNTLNGHPSSSSTSSASSATSNTINNNLAFFQANPHLLNSAALHSTLISQPAINNNNVTLSANMVVFKEPMNIQPNEKRTNRLFFEPANQKDIFVQPEHTKLDSLTPCSTPNQKRKDTNRRRSNLFTPNKKEDKKNNLNDMGIGRSIPIKQGFLYKKTNSTINKDWKKKFVTLNDDGSLRYYPSMNDYMDESHGKEIDLQKTTIKIPGSNKPRIGKSLIQVDTNRINNDINMLSLNGNGNLNGIDKNLYDDATHSLPHQPVLINDAANSLARTDVNSKKRHRRVKSNHKSDQNKDEDQEGFEFIIVSLDNKQWHFEASSNEEREEWVQAIEQQILSSLQTNETNKLKSKNGLTADNITILTMKNVLGNSTCADCDAPNPVWASLNLGTLICIECSGIHRNLGTHLSRVRSLELDDWSNELVQLMTSIGNRMLNSIYEANTKVFGRNKPTPNSPREEKEKWIRAKYESKQFLASLPNKEITVGKQLLEAVSRQDISSVILCLSHSKHEDVNSCVSQLDKRTSLHIAASQSNIVILQLLIWYGANVECQDNQGRNALSYARNAKSSECIQLLIHNGSSDTNLNTSQQSNFISNPNANSNANGTGNTNTLTKKTTSTSYLGFINNALSNCNNGTNGNNSQSGHYDKIPFNVV